MNYFIQFILIITFITFAKTDFIYSCTEDKTIALTFDDGPHEYTRELVDYLRRQSEVKVTFFTLAEFHFPFAKDEKEYQDAMKLAHDSGYQIASHTYSHEIPEDKDDFKKNLSDNDEFIENAIGDRPRYFRAPKGECSKECQESLKEWDYRLIQWDTDTNDWDLETSGSEEQRVKDSIKFLEREFAEERSSYLILMHDSQSYTVKEIAPWIIERSGMKDKGYRFVTVAECLGDKASMYRSGKVYDDHALHSVVAGNNTITNVNNTQNGNGTIETDGPLFALENGDAHSLEYSFIYTFISLITVMFLFFN